MPGHRFSECFLQKNLEVEPSRRGVMEEIFAPHCDHCMADVAGQIAHGAVIGTFTRKSRERRLTGESIVMSAAQMAPTTI